LTQGEKAALDAAAAADGAAETSGWARRVLLRSAQVRASRRKHKADAEAPISRKKPAKPNDT
jgi:hypothetical protein